MDMLGIRLLEVKQTAHKLSQFFIDKSNGTVNRAKTSQVNHQQLSELCYSMFM